MAYHIGCLEACWSEKATDQRSVEPLLQVVKANHSARYVHRQCYTTEEFVHWLKALRRLSSHNLIYIAAHGSPFTLHLAGKRKISIDELEYQMREGFEDRILHIGACRFVLSQSELRWQTFMEETQIAAVSGFSKDVSWVESAALEMLWLAHLQHYSRFGTAVNTFYARFPDLCKNNGFQVFRRV